MFTSSGNKPRRRKLVEIANVVNKDPATLIEAGILLRIAGLKCHYSVILI